MIGRSETPEHHKQEAEHLRSLAETATTPAMKARLLDKAEDHERLARGESEAPELERAQ